MQKRDLEDLALDLNELLFLLKEAGTRKELLPVAERHINRLMRTLEEIKENLNSSDSTASVDDEKAVTAHSQEIIEQEIVPTEELKQNNTPEIIIASTTVFGEQLRPAAELSKGLTLNDTFRFARELFNGDKDEMNRVLQDISQMNSLAEVTSYLSSQIEWDEENDTVKDFIELLKKYFV